MIDAAPHEYKEKLGGCPDCGNSPVNHLEAYLSQTLAVWSSRSANRERKGFFGSVRNASDALYERIEPLFFKLLTWLPGAKFSHDPSKARTYRSQVIWEEANRRNIRMEQLVFWNLYTDIYRAHLRGRWRYFISIPTPPELARESGAWMDDKFLLKEALAKVGVASPRIVSVTTLADAKRVLHDFTTPVVVKPRSGSRGRHTTVNVRTERELEDAFRVAQRLCHYVAIEEYISCGSVCRATVVGGKLAGFFQAHPPRIVGDGRSTISELVTAKNAARPDRVQNIVLTDEHGHFIERTGYTENSVLPAGHVLALTHRTGRLFGGYTRELFGREHPKLCAYVERAAHAIDTPLVGFDLMIPDPERDPDEQQWGIIEANSLPYIDLHYLPLEGEPTNVAAAVWNLWGDVQREAVV
jgi:D-alanine-D-alanine ligase-like ATP-grasp enzyme